MFENVPILQAATGGILIGLSATILLITTGRIAGISGILNGLLDRRADRNWRLFFLFGLMLGSALHYHIFTPVHIAAPSMVPWVMVAGGVLVGFGTRLGGGCTSGHGVCGLGRLSRRSLVATCIFMATGMLAVYVLRLLAGGSA